MFVLCMRMVVTSLYQLSHVVNLTEDAIGSVTIHLAVNECNSNTRLSIGFCGPWQSVELRLHGTNQGTDLDA